MTTMIERVARAMALADDEDYMESAREYDRRARAAIEAMRKPTEAMNQAGRDNNYMKYATSAWEAMIDAALSEGKEE